MTPIPPTSKWSHFPTDYRADAVKEILRWVTLGESGGGCRHQWQR